MQNNWFVPVAEVSSEQRNQHNDNNIYLNKQEMKIVVGLHKISVVKWLSSCKRFNQKTDF